jgi:hypothetical protein
MNLKRIFAIIPLLTLPLLAAAPKLTFEGQFSSVISAGDLNMMTDTGNLTGYSLGAAVRLATREGLSFRLHANLLSIRGNDGTGLENAAPKHFFGGMDICEEFGKLTVFGGLMAVKWKQGDATTPNYSVVLSPYSDNRSKGTKFGGRIGVEYAITPALHGVASFNQTEFNRKTNPSWLSLGVSYRFGGI